MAARSVNPSPWCRQGHRRQKTLDKVTLIPLGRQMGDLFERPSLFKEMRGAWDNFELLLAFKELESLLIPFNDRRIVPPYDQERRRPDQRQGREGEIRAPASRDNGANMVGTGGRSNQRRGAPRTRAEIAQRQRGEVEVHAVPVGQSDEPVGEHVDIEAIFHGLKVHLFFGGGQEVDQESRETGLLQFSGHVTVAWTMPTASTAVSEENHSSRMLGIARSPTRSACATKI